MGQNFTPFVVWVTFLFFYYPCEKMIPISGRAHLK